MFNLYFRLHYSTKTKPSEVFDNCIEFLVYGLYILANSQRAAIDIESFILFNCKDAPSWTSSTSRYFRCVL